MGAAAACWVVNFALLDIWVVAKYVLKVTQVLENAVWFVSSWLSWLVLVFLVIQFMHLCLA